MTKLQTEGKGIKIDYDKFGQIGTIKEVKKRNKYIGYCSKCHLPVEDNGNSSPDGAFKVKHKVCMTNQKSLDKNKPKDVSKCCNCNVNVSNGKEGTNYYIYDKCKQPCDVISKKKPKELDWDNFVKSYNTNFGKDANGIKYEFYEDDLINFIQSLLQKQREEILNLECLKEEEIDIHIFDGHNDILMCRNQLRNEIKKEIKKL